MLVGVVMYWCEGAKAKPWRQQYELSFINSDVGLVRVFLAFLESVGVPRAGLTYRVSIHDTADAEAATRWWAERIDVPLAAMRRPTIKRHEAKTKRHNTDGHYHGCLAINVPRSRELYWWIEGVMTALAGSVGDRHFARCEDAS